MNPKSSKESHASVLAMEKGINLDIAHNMSLNSEQHLQSFYELAK